MRLRNWIAVLVSVVLMLAAGTIALLMNRSALQAADTVHHDDTRALGSNNAVLAGALQMLSAGELNEFAIDHKLNLSPGDAADRRKLAAFVGKSTYFRYGVALTDLLGAPINATRAAAGLPAPADPGYGPLRDLLLAGKPGFSSVMLVGGVVLEAVAVPVMVGGAPAAILIGYNQVATTQLQSYLAALKTPTHLSMIADSTGRVGAASDPARLGTLVDPAIIALLKGPAGAPFVEYHVGETQMIANVVRGTMPGGWAYVRTQTLASFDGAVKKRSQTVNLTLLAMLLIGVIGLLLLGYRTQIQRRRADARFQALFQHAPDMVAVLNPDGRIKYASPSASTVLKLAAGSMYGASVFDLVHPEDRAGVQERFALLTEDAAVLRMQCRVLDGAGGNRWFEFTASNQLHNPALSGIVINARDISENKAFEQLLAHEAEHDPLTGLPNRRRMQDALDSTLRTAAVAVLFVDLDGFKPINDVYGHGTGDELLRQVATRLSACVRAQDVLARVGGDEFVLLMPGVTEQVDAESMSERFQDAIREPFDVGGVTVAIGASVGVHLAPTASDSDQTLRAADHAMYAVKRAGASRRAGNGREAVTVGRHRGEA